MIRKPKVCILTGFGINCEDEFSIAFEKSGADVSKVHFNELKNKLEEFEIFAIPGGWSFADDIQSGRVLANKIRFKLHNEFRRFVDSNKPVIGICNGFQILTQLGVIPGWDNWKNRAITLAYNKRGRFIDDWVLLRTEDSVCTFAQDSTILRMPIRHGEGQVVLKDQDTLQKLIDNKQVVFRYAAQDHLKAKDYPDNPNGSADAIAGLCNEHGNVLGMMPHPECHIRYLQDPLWTNKIPSANQDGLFNKILTKTGIKKEKIESTKCTTLFDNIVENAKKFI